LFSQYHPYYEEPAPKTASAVAEIERQHLTWQNKIDDIHKWIKTQDERNQRVDGQLEELLKASRKR